jgi:hypothetical protein
MNTQITITGKRVETIYAFTVSYKGKTITGDFINGIIKLTSLGGITQSELTGLVIDIDKLKQAIADYDKLHT